MAADLEKNQIFTAKIEGYTSEGLGVSRIEGRAVFVKGAVKGEVCRIRIVKAGKNAVYGKIEEILEPSPERIEPGCPAYPMCGGCSLRHLCYEEELRLKKDKVAAAFRRIGGVDLEPEEIIGSDNIEGYRNKAVYSVGEKDGRPVTGFYRDRTHQVIPAENCAIESDFSRRAAAAVRKYMEENGVSAYLPETGKGIRRIFTRYGFKSKEGEVVVVTGRGKLLHRDELIRTVLENCPETVSIMRNVNDRPGDTVLTGDFETIWGKDHIKDTLCGFEFSISPAAFYQINRDQAQRLYEKAVEFADLKGDETVLDLYCGAGTITLRLAKDAKTAVGVEIVESSIENAKKNAEENGVKNVRFMAADAEKAAKKLKDEGLSPDVVVVDPPRKGLSPETPGIIASMAPKRVVYVSCDCATLARDMKVFEGLGYKAKRAVAVDMFPRTSHIECVVKFEREAG